MNRGIPDNGGVSNGYWIDDLVEEEGAVANGRWKLRVQETKMLAIIISKSP
jgi:hypothetical protein